MPSAYQQRLLDAGLKKRSGRIRGIIEALPPETKAAVMKEFPGTLERVQTTLDYIAVAAQCPNPELLTPQMISGVQNGLQLVEQYSGAVASGQVAQAQNLDTAVDGVLNALMQWPQQNSSTDSIRRATSTFRRSFAAKLVPVHKEIQELGNQLQALKEARDAAVVSVENIEQEAQTLADDRLERLAQRITEHEQRLAETTGAVDTQKSRLDEAIARYEKQFSDAQANRTDQFQELTATLESRISELATELSDEAASVITDMRKHRDETKDLVGVIAATGTSSAFGQEARDQRGIANKWRIAAVAISILAAGVMMWALVRGVSDEASVAETVVRVVASVVFFGIAGYAASQSSQHRRREEFARRRELDLVAFGPFIAALPEEKQEAAREALVTKLFGQPTDASMDGGPIVTNDTITLIGRLMEILTKAGSK